VQCVLHSMQPLPNYFGLLFLLTLVGLVVRIFVCRAIIFDVEISFLVARHTVPETARRVLISRSSGEGEGHTG